MSNEAKRHEHSSERVAAVAGIGFVFVAIFAWAWSPASFIADDSYFYLVTARRLVEDGQQTFSGPFLTNGIHPLWFYLLTAWDQLIAWLSPDWLTSARAAVPLAGALYVVAAVLLMRACRQARLSVGLVAVPLLVYSGVMAVLFSEAHAMLLAMALFVGRVVERPFETPRRAVVTGLAAGLLLLARLDTLFWVGATFLVAMFMLRDRRRTIALAASVGALIVLPYLLSNLHVFGGLVPVSGWMKSSFPDPQWIGFTTHGNLSLMLGGYSVPVGIVPILLGLATAVVSRESRRSLLFGGLLLGTAGHAVYTGLFASMAGWPWYYLPNVLLAGLSVHHLTARAPRWSTRLATAVAFVAVLGATVYLVRVRHGADPANQPIIRWMQDNRVARKTMVVSESPGQLAFYSDNNIVSNDLLTANLRLYQRLGRSPNPLAELLAASAEAGYPVDYVIWNTGSFFRVSADARRLEYLDPKYGHDTAAFGALDMPSPMHREAGFIVWALGPGYASYGLPHAVGPVGPGPIGE